MNGELTPLTETTELRRLTIVFCDIVGSSRIAQRLDPEDYRDLLDAYHGHCQAVFARYEGHVAQLLGDGALAYFGWPVAHDDDAKRAIHAGLEIVDGIAELSKECQAKWRVELQVRVGIDTGRVLVGEMGGGGRREQLAIGPTANVADRLQGLAPPDDVIISGATFAVTEGYFNAQPFGRHKLKGLGDEEVQTYLVHGTTGAETRLEVALRKGLTPFVGRESEVEKLETAWREAEGGAGRVVLLEGDAGIGKSRHVHEFRRRLGSKAVEVDCFCSPYHGNTELYPVKSLIGRRLGFEQDMSPEEKLDRLEERLKHLPEMAEDAVPLLAALLSVPLGERYVLPPITPLRLRQRTLEVAFAWLMAVASRQPTFLVFEDLHWADHTTIEFLDMVVQAAPTTQLCAVFTFRPEFDAPWAGAAHVVTMNLGRLGNEEATALITHVAGGKRLPDDVTKRILDRTGCLPLFVEEVTKAVLRAADFEEHPDRYELRGPMPEDLVPDSLDGTLMSRLDRLGESKQVAQFASVVGRDFQYDMMCAVAPFVEDTVRGSLEKLVADGLLLSEGTPPDALYVFKHEMIREVAYESLPRSDRRKYHGRIASKILERFTRVAENQPEIVAHHFAGAGNDERAVEFWGIAGSRALHRAAVVDASAHLGNALKTLEALPKSEERLGQELQIQMAQMAALMAMKGWAATEAEAACLRAKELAEALGDHESLFGALWGLWTVHFLRSDLGPAAAVAEGVLAMASQAKALLDQAEGLPPEQMMVEGAKVTMLLELAHHAVGYTQYFQGRLEEAAEHAQQGIALFNEELERVLIGNFQFASTNALRIIDVGTRWQTGFSADAQARHEEHGAVAKALGHAPSYCFWLTVSASYLCYQGAHERVRTLTEELIPLAREERLELWEGPATLYHGWAVGCLGDPEAGLLEMERGVEMVLGTGSRLLMVQGYGLLAQVQLLAGRAKQALASLQEAIELSERGGERHMLSEVHRLRAQALGLVGGSEPAEIEGCLRAALAEANRQTALNLEMRAAVDLGQWLHVQGRREDAHAAVDDVLQRFPEGSDDEEPRAARAFLDEIAQEV